jgi:hypothetical protein
VDETDDMIAVVDDAGDMPESPVLFAARPRPRIGRGAQLRGLRHPHA